MAIERLVDELDRSYAERRTRLADPSVYNDHRQAADAGRRLKELEAPKRLADEWRQARDDLEGGSGRSRAHGDGRRLEDEVERLDRSCSSRSSSATQPTRRTSSWRSGQGVGGDEAALWPGDVRRMLTRYAERLGLRTETLLDERERGRRREGSGVRRQGPRARSRSSSSRAVPIACSAFPRPSPRGGSTSTATVAVMPEAEEVEVEIAENDLKVDVHALDGPRRAEREHGRTRRYGSPTCRRASWSRCRTRSRSCRTPPEGPRVLRARLYELEREKQQAELAASRRSQIGTGERAEKIRTYNFPENRVTDHRIKLTLHRLDQVLEGDMGSSRRPCGRRISARRSRGLGVTARAGARLRRAERLAAADSSRRESTPRSLFAHVLGVRRRSSRSIAPSR